MPGDASNAKGLCTSRNIWRQINILLYKCKYFVSYLQIIIFKNTHILVGNPPGIFVIAIFRIRYDFLCTVQKLRHAHIVLYYWSFKTDHFDPSRAQGFIVLYVAK